MTSETVKPILQGTERMLWEWTTRSLLNAGSQYYLWSQVYDLASRKIGDVIYRGDHWSKRVNALAREILTELGIDWEDYAGHLYIAGKRVYWNSSKGRWEQDDYR